MDPGPWTLDARPLPGHHTPLLSRKRARALDFDNFLSALFSACSLHPTLCNLHPTPYTRQPTPDALEPYTWNPGLGTLIWTLDTRRKMLDPRP